MKEKIYTIPINEALEQVGECPLCMIRRDMEEKALAYFLGDAMMEPDVRITTNENGFCHMHSEKMLGKKNVLPLALMLQSRLEYVINDLSKAQKLKKKRFFKRGNKDEDIIKRIETLTSDCAVCQKIQRQFDNCVDNFAYLLIKDGEFKNKYLSSKGLCIKHFGKLLSALQNSGAPEDTVSNVINLQMENLKRLSGEIDFFTRKFDYRYKDAGWDGTQDAPERCCQKLSGGI